MQRHHPAGRAAKPWHKVAPSVKNTRKVRDNGVVIKERTDSSPACVVLRNPQVVPGRVVVDGVRGEQSEVDQAHAKNTEARHDCRQQAAARRSKVAPQSHGHTKAVASANGQKNGRKGNCEGPIVQSQGTGHVHGQGEADGSDGRAEDRGLQDGELVQLENAHQHELAQTEVAEAEQEDPSPDLGQGPYQPVLDGKHAVHGVGKDR